MSVELYLVKPDATGRIVFPFWDERGEPLVPVEHRVIASLKWAARSPCISETGLGLQDDPIPPEQLVEGAEHAMRLLLDEVADLHPDFRRLADEAGDFQARGELLSAFETEQEWVGGDDASRTRAFAQARAASSSLRWILGEIRKAGQQGFYGCWSF